MYVDSYLEMFTTLFGWLFYNNLWHVLSDSGLLLLPFIGMILDKIIDYKNGTEVGDAEELATKGVLTELVTACGVIMMCGMPYMVFEATEVVFTPSAMSSSFTQTSYTVNSIESTFGQNGSFDHYPVSVEVPVMWWAVHNISIGITHAVMAGMPSMLDMRRYIESMKRLAINDPNLRKEAESFKRDCFDKALSKYNREKPWESGATATYVNSILANRGVEDPYWIGSTIFTTLNGYYNILRSEVSVDGFLYDATRDTEWRPTDPDRPVFGRPTCRHWWLGNGTQKGLREKIIDENTFIQTLAATVESALSADLRDDLIVKVALHQTEITYTPRGYDFAYSNTTPGGVAMVNKVVASAKQVTAGGATAIEIAKNSVNVTMLLNASPIFQALLLMLVVIFIPFVLFLSKYSISAVLTVAWALFSFRFLTACWMLAWWLDQNIIAAMYPDMGDLTKIPLNVNYEASTNLALIYMLNYLYIVIPVIFTIVTGWAGYNVIRGMGANTMMGGLSNAGGNMASKVGNAAKTAVTKGMK